MNTLNKKIVEIANSIEKGIINKEAGARQIENEVRAVLNKLTKFADYDLLQELAWNYVDEDGKHKTQIEEEHDEFISEIENADPQDDENYIYDAWIIEGYKRELIDLENNMNK